MLASIGVLDQRDRLKDMLEEVLVDLSVSRVEVRATRRGGQEFLDVTGDIDPRAEGVVRDQIARVIGGHIRRDLEPLLLERICQRVYGNLTADEKAAVLAIARRTLRDGTHATARRWNSIQGKLLEHLRGEDLLNLKGFITFRLKDYVDDLEDAVDQAIDDYLIEREYSEFVRLLRCFVDAQTVKIPEVHVIVRRDGSPAIFDEDMRQVDGGSLKEFVMDTVDSEVAYEDFLVSALISVAPGHIVIHDAFGQGDPESLTTVANVFGERVRKCRGCKRCRREGRA